jgi:hypothetical protein
VLYQLSPWYGLAKHSGLTTTEPEPVHTPSGERLDTLGVGRSMGFRKLKRGNLAVAH